MIENAQYPAESPGAEDDDLSLPAGGTRARRSFRDALGRFATGVTVVTARDPDGAPIGLTVNSFASVSLDPPLILWSVALAASSASVFQPGAPFVVNVLAGNQLALARAFAAQDSGERFSGLDVCDNVDGVPVLGGCAAEYHCRVEARHPGGDHAIVVGRVSGFRAGSVAPLLFHDGRFSVPGQPLRR